MESMGKNILELFYNQPTKQWRFKEITDLVGIADNKVSKWLKRFVIEKLVRRVKSKGRMPYYISNYTNPDYQNRKRLFALNKLYESGILNHVLQLENARTVVLFGSMTGWNWYEQSDVDIFVYGDDSDLEQGKYERKLGRTIQLFSYKNKNELKKISEGLLKSITKGIILKGDLDFLTVRANA